MTSILIFLGCHDDASQTVQKRSARSAHPEAAQLCSSTFLDFLRGFGCFAPPLFSSEAYPEHCCCFFVSSSCGHSQCLADIVSSVMPDPSLARRSTRSRTAMRSLLCKVASSPSSMTRRSNLVWSWQRKHADRKERMVGMSGGEIFHEMMLRLGVKQVCKCSTARLFKLPPSAHILD